LRRRPSSYAQLLPPLLALASLSRWLPCRLQLASSFVPPLLLQLLQPSLHRRLLKLLAQAFFAEPRLPASSWAQLPQQRPRQASSDVLPRLAIS
jgi:hypothetical protein